MDTPGDPSVSKAGQWVEFSAQQILVPGWAVQWCPAVKQDWPLESL